jgi:hypothetical protein
MLAYPLGTDLGAALMARIKLTDRFIANSKPGQGGRADYFDVVTKGLVLRVSSGGRKTWCLFYT